MIQTTKENTINVLTALGAAQEAVTDVISQELEENKENILMFSLKDKTAIILFRPTETVLLQYIDNVDENSNHDFYTLGWYDELPQLVFRFLVLCYPINY